MLENISTSAIGLAFQRGLSIYCASCKKYWEGRLRGLEGDKCTSKTPCGGPIAGMVFPNYEGIISDFGRWCFVCASDATKGVIVGGSERILGVCDDHIEMLRNVVPVGSDMVRPVIRVVTREGDIEINKYLARKKTLGQAISELDSVA